jgi:hypothetical protein
MVLGVMVVETISLSVLIYVLDGLAVFESVEHYGFTITK